MRIQNFNAEELVRSVRAFAVKAREPKFKTSAATKKSHAHNSSIWGEDRQILETCGPISRAEMLSFRLSEKSCLKKKEKVESDRVKRPDTFNIHKHTHHTLQISYSFI